MKDPYTFGHKLRKRGRPSLFMAGGNVLNYYRMTTEPAAWKINGWKERSEGKSHCQGA